MSSWQDIFLRKQLGCASEILSLIPAGSRIALGHAAGEPGRLVEALVRGYEGAESIEILHMVPLGPCHYCEPGAQDRFRHNSCFVGNPSRLAVNEGRADYTPVFFSQLPRLFQEKTLPLDVALICVSPPDAEGWMSYGVSVDYTQAAARHAQLVIAEVNELMPRTFGARIHISEVDYVLRSERSLPELPRPKIGPVEHHIGLHIASLIEDGACLQLGIGSIPDAVLAVLHDKHDLGIHTEMFSDGVMELYQAGVITNRRKTIDTGKMVATFLMGTQNLYKFVHENQAVLMQPVDYTNSVKVAGQIDHLIAINSALQVDLNGQVCADMIGYQQYSGVGGQVDFVRAAAASHGGRSIIALPATAKQGRISRIVAQLDAGACVTTSRYDVDTIVTEFGIAELRGKTLRQRARDLIGIAHPAFRDQLWDQLQSSPARALYV